VYVITSTYSEISTLAGLGRVHDARVFSNSETYHKGENSLLFPNWIKKVQLPDKESAMPIVLLGDPAYPLKPWLMKTFSDRGHISSNTCS